MEQTKDYSLLRPFDLEAAKRGEPIMGINLNWPIIFCGTTTNGQVIFVEYTDKSGGDQEVDNIRMAPLAWVEGKPVYTGDVLYSSFFKEHPSDKENLTGHFVVGGYGTDMQIYKATDASFRTTINSCSWNKPKVKKSGWLNIYPNNDCSCMHPSKLAADTEQAGPREACIEVFWEA